MTKFKETEIGKIPEDWEIKKIGEVCQLVKEQYKPKASENLLYIGLEHIEQGTLQLNSIGNSSDTISNKYRFKKGQILFGKLRPYFRKVYRPSFGGVCSTDIFVIDSEKGTDNSFLFYFFANPKIIEEASRSAEGTRMPRASWGYLSNLNEQFPKETEQKAIAKILSDLDSKIELNQEMNKNLEAIAQALFKHWFVDFEFPNEQGKPYKSSGGKMVLSKELQKEIPVGWDIKSLDMVAEYLNGLALQKFPAENGDFYPVIKIRELKNGITDSSDRANTNIPENYVVHDGDILFSWSGSLEMCIWCGGIGALNQHLFKVSSEKYPKWFYYFWTKEFLPEFKHIAEGKATTMGHIQRHHLAESKLPVPPEAVLKAMNVSLQSIFERYINNSVESKQISRIRDSLLPKLMSGSVRVGAT